MDANKSWPLGFEFVDIEIINHTKGETEELEDKWDCNQCNLFFLSEDKLIQHKKKHVSLPEEVVKCKYCNKILPLTEESKESHSNRKCETCEYRCSKCPQRFLRHSSLLNHERNHSSPKKRKVVLNNKKGAVNSNIEQRVYKKRLIEKVDTIEAVNAENKLIDKDVNKLSPNIRKKNQETLCETLPLNNKRLSSRLSNITEKSDSLSKKNLNIKHTGPDSQTATPIIDKKTILYKPFSCHVCGANFASDNVLLDHIQTHGENAKGFKCKHCGDEFDDIYKMQYHLAICPLAEDELESSLKINTSLEFSTKKSDENKSVNFKHETPPVRKRGRPRKITVESSGNVNDSLEKDILPSRRTRGSIKKIKIEEPSSPVISPKVTRGSLARTIVKTNSLLEDPDNDLGSDDNSVDDPLAFKGKSDENINESFESEEDSRKKVHSCPFPKCGIKFTREKALLCHMRNHDDDFDEALKCHKCDVPFDDLQSLRTHINICKGIKEEKDDDFNEPNSQAYDLADKTYQTFQRNKGTFMCRVCGRSYLTQERLESHLCVHSIRSIESKKTVKKPFVDTQPMNRCNLCNAEFENELEENNHMILHARVKVGFPCHKCFLIFTSDKDMVIHFNDCHQKTTNETVYKCYLCSRRFQDINKLAKHKQNHARLSVKGKFYKCISFKKSIKSSVFIKHKALNTMAPVPTNSHPGVRNSLEDHAKPNTSLHRFNCIVCYKRFITRGTLIKHAQIHNTKGILCLICRKGFLNSRYLEMHVHNKHMTDISNLECSVCNKVEIDETLLRNHIMKHAIPKSIDEKTSNYNKSFNLSFHTKNKQRNLSTIETNVQNPKQMVKKRRSFYRVLKELQINCPICSKSYYEDDILRQHVLKKHVNQVNSNECKVCKKVEYSSKDLTTHIMTHIPCIGNDVNSTKENVDTRLCSMNNVCIASINKNPTQLFVTNKNPGFSNSQYIKDSQNSLVQEKDSFSIKSNSTHSKEESCLESVLLDSTRRCVFENIQKLEAYEVTNKNIVKCVHLLKGNGNSQNQTLMFQDTEYFLSKLLVMKGAVCTVCVKTFQSADELAHHTNTLVFC